MWGCSQTGMTSPTIKIDNPVSVGAGGEKSNVHCSTLTGREDDHASTPQENAEGQTVLRIGCGGLYDAVTVEVNGPELDVQGSINPFADYRLDVVFRHGEGEWIVPGYFAGCENAADNACMKGTLWKAHFRPHLSGEWQY